MPTGLRAGVLALALSSAPVAARGADTERPQVMILGTYHLANSTRNVVKHEQRDVLAPDRQREVSAVVAGLARFRPTRIALEIEPDRQVEIDRSYHDYLQGRRPLGARETEQLGFRLGKLMNVDQFCLIDYQNSYNYAAVVEFLRKRGPPGALKRLEAENAAAAAAGAERDRKYSVAELLARGNSDPVVRAMHWSELFTIDAWDEQETPGPDLMASWYERNIRMFARIRQCIRRRDDRLLVIVGWGHVKLLRDLVRDSADLSFVGPLGYLPERPPQEQLPERERTELFRTLSPSVPLPRPGD
jgi:Family of unknown function (DUF5694)